MTVLISIFAVIIILGVLATAHELGHFFVARLLKVKAYEVSIFVGPPLFKWKRKEVEYSIRCIPVGAYVRFSEIDDDGNEVKTDDPTNLLNQPRWKRLIISLAGPFVNLVLGVIIFAIYFSCQGFVSLKVDETYEGTQLYNQQYEVGDTIVAVDGRRVFTEDDLAIYFQFKPDDENMVLTFKSAKTGDKYDITLVPETTKRAIMGITRYAGVDDTVNGWEISTVDKSQNDGNPILKPGDYLLKIDDHLTADEDETVDYLSTKNGGDVIHVVFLRDDEEMEGDITLSEQEIVNSRGVVLTYEEIEGPKDIVKAIYNSTKMPASIFNMTGMVISSALNGQVEPYNVVSGPVGVVNVVDTVVSSKKADTSIKISTLVMLAGMISVALTISNMLPLPGLDGFQLIILFVEMIIGRKLPEKGEKIIAVVGFFVLLGLVLLAFASDIAKIVIEGW